MSFASRMMELAASNSIICYHRTKSASTAREIIMAGINAGNGLYGNGFYTTQDVESQQNPRMVKLYGRYILQCKIDTSDYLNFDKGIDAVNAQLKSAGINPKKWLDNFGKFDDLELSPSEYKKYSSYYALCCIETYGARLPKKFSGIIYTGKRDGRCCLAWRIGTVKPFAIAYAPTSKSPIKFTKMGSDTRVGFADMAPAMLRGVVKAAANTPNPELEKYAIANPLQFGMQLCVKNPDVKNPSRVSRVIDDTLELLQMVDTKRGFSAVVRKCLLAVFAQSFLRFYIDLTKSGNADVKWKMTSVVNYSLPLNFGITKSSPGFLLPTILDMGKRGNQASQARALVDMIKPSK